MLPAQLVLIASVDTATITMDRSGAALAFDLGICLVLLSMPVLALFVAVETVQVLVLWVLVALGIYIVAWRQSD